MRLDRQHQLRQCRVATGKRVLSALTQQNAALVEQAASAAESPKDQSQRRVGAIAVFRLS